MNSFEETQVVEVNNSPAVPMPNPEIDVQIATAHRYPRSIAQFRQRALDMATIDEETAASCFYKLPRNGKFIEGPSIRLAEIVASAWKNLRFGARVVEETDKWIVAQGMAHDLENNVAMTIEVRRKITDRYNKRYSDDMIVVTSNAACSIALRNAIFKVIPKSFIEMIYEQAKKKATGSAETLASRRQKAIDHCQKMGLSQDRVLATLGRAGVEEIGLKDLENLRGLITAIKDGESSIDDLFPSTTTAKQNYATKTEGLKERLKGSESSDPAVENTFTDIEELPEDFGK